MKENNLQKKPSSAREYANLFLLDENGKKGDFSNVKNVCLITIGCAETSWILLQEFTGKNITIIDRKSEIDYIETLIKIHKRNDIRIIRKEVETDEAVLSAILDLNMNMFDLIIANPPYGKSSSLIKKISKSILSKCEGEFVCLGPDNMFKDDFLRSKLEPGFAFADPKTSFGLDTGGRLIIAKLNKDLDDEKSIEDIFLDKKVATLLKAITEYNAKVEQTFWNINGNSFARKWNYEIKDCNKKESFPEDIKHKKFCECVEEGNLFFKPLFWACGSPKNVVDSYEGQYNIQGKWLDVFNEKRAGDVLVFKTKQERDNFYKWTTQHYGPGYTWIGVTYDKYLCGYIRKAIRDLIGQGAGASFFTKYLPQVDWSRPWTDEEILRELGLPEDFLNNF